MAGSRGAHPCPYCLWPNKVMGMPTDEAVKYMLPGNTVARPEQRNLSSAADDIMCYCNPPHSLQKKGTENILGLHSSQYLIPILHVHLGIANKLLEVLDRAHSLCDPLWKSRTAANFNPLDDEEEDKTPGRAHLASVLSKYGIRRERCYAGNISGAPATVFLRPGNMSHIIREYFEIPRRYGDGPEHKESPEFCLMQRVGVQESHISDVKGA